MKVTATQKRSLKAHSLWLANNEANKAKYIYLMTIEIVERNEAKGDADKWLLYIANNVYIQLCQQPDKCKIVALCPITTNSHRSPKGKIIKMPVKVY